MGTIRNLPGTLGKKKVPRNVLSLIKHAKKSFERYEIRCSRCCTSPFIDSTQNDQTVENVKPNINAKFFKPTHPSQRCPKRTLRRVPHFDTTRTPPLFSMYETLSKIYFIRKCRTFWTNRRYTLFSKNSNLPKNLWKFILSLGHQKKTSLTHHGFPRCPHQGGFRKWHARSCGDGQSMIYFARSWTIIHIWARPRGAGRRIKWLNKSHQPLSNDWNILEPIWLELIGYNFYKFYRCETKVNQWHNW